MAPRVKTFSSSPKPIGPCQTPLQRASAAGKLALRAFSTLHPLSSAASPLFLFRFWSRPSPALTPKASSLAGDCLPDPVDPDSAPASLAYLLPPLTLALPLPPAQVLSIPRPLRFKLSGGGLRELVETLSPTVLRDTVSSPLLDAVATPLRDSIHRYPSDIPAHALPSLKKVGISVSGFGFKDHPHSIHKTIEIHLLFEHWCNLAPRPSSIMLMKPSKFEKLASANQNFSELCTYALTPRDVTRYPESCLHLPTKLPRGYVDPAVHSDPTVQFIILLGDPLQGEYHSSHPDSSHSRLKSEILHLRPYVDLSCLWSRRLPQDIGHFFGVPTLSKEPGFCRYDPTLSPGWKQMTTSMNASSVLQQCGFSSVTIASSQGSTLTHPACINLDKNSSSLSLSHSLVALTRSKVGVIFTGDTSKLNLCGTANSMFSRYFARKTINLQSLLSFEWPDCPCLTAPFTVRPRTQRGGFIPPYLPLLRPSQAHLTPSDLPNLIADRRAPILGDGSSNAPHISTHFLPETRRPYHPDLPSAKPEPADHEPQTPLEPAAFEPVYPGESFENLAAHFPPPHDPASKERWYKDQLSQQFPFLNKDFEIAAQPSNLLVPVHSSVNDPTLLMASLGKRLRFRPSSSPYVIKPKGEILGALLFEALRQAYHRNPRASEPFRGMPQHFPTETVEVTQYQGELLQLSNMAHRYLSGGLQLPKTNAMPAPVDSLPPPSGRPVGDDHRSDPQPDLPLAPAVQETQVAASVTLPFQWVAHVIKSESTALTVDLAANNTLRNLISSFRSAELITLEALLMPNSNAYNNPISAFLVWTISSVQPASGEELYYYGGQSITVGGPVSLNIQASIPADLRRVNPRIKSSVIYSDTPRLTCTTMKATTATSNPLAYLLIRGSVRVSGSVGVRMA